jgi:hypothetical protein
MIRMEEAMKNKLYSIMITVLALALLLGGNFDFARGRLPTAAAAGGAGYISIPAAAFTPADDALDYVLDESGLMLETDATSGQFWAPVYLPHGATLSKLTFYRYDMVAGGLPYCYLRTMSNSWATEAIATVCTDNPIYNGFTSIYTTDFSVPVVDNSQYTYSLQCYLSRQTVTLTSVLVGLRIEYSYPVYLPLTVR